MIDLNKKYISRTGFEVHLYDIVGDSIFGRYYNTECQKWIPEKWCAKTGMCFTYYGQAKLDLVEVLDKPFNIVRVFSRDIEYRKYFNSGLHIPSFVEYIATDAEGKIYGHLSHPSEKISSGIYLAQCEFEGDWKESIQKV